MSEFIAELKDQIEELKEALRPLVAGEAFGLRCNYCLTFDSTLGNPHSIDCAVVIGRKVLICGKTKPIFCKSCGVEVCPRCSHVHLETPEMICLDKWHRDQT